MRKECFLARRLAWRGITIPVRLHTVDMIAGAVAAVQTAQPAARRTASACPCSKVY